MSRDSVYLHHILDAIARVEEYAKVGRERFMAEPHWQDATVRQLEIIGEAVKHLSPGLTDRYPAVPWRRIAGMRDVLVHDYMGVDMDAVWEVTQRNLAELKQHIQAALAAE